MVSFKRNFNCRTTETEEDTLVGELNMLDVLMGTAKERAKEKHGCHRNTYHFFKPVVSDLP